MVVTDGNKLHEHVAELPTKCSYTTRFAQCNSMDTLIKMNGFMFDLSVLQQNFICHLQSTGAFSVVLMKGFSALFFRTRIYM